MQDGEGGGQSRDRMVIINEDENKGPGDVRRIGKRWDHETNDHISIDLDTSPGRAEMYNAEVMKPDEAKLESSAMPRSSMETLALAT